MDVIISYTGSINYKQQYVKDIFQLTLNAVDDAY